MEPRKPNYLQPPKFIDDILIQVMHRLAQDWTNSNDESIKKSTDISVSSMIENKPKVEWRWYLNQYDQMKRLYGGQHETYMQ